jgi:hypothetical protein
MLGKNPSLLVRKIVNALMISKPARGTIASAGMVTKGTHTSMGVAKVLLLFEF